MNEYLVRSHLGGFYISSSEPEVIELYCETCGDYDQIETSWNSEIKNAKVNALTEYFTRESIKSKQEFERRMLDYICDDVKMIDIIENIISDIIFDSEASEELIEYLKEDGNLSTLEYKQLLKKNRENLKKQLMIIKDNLSFYITNENAIKMVNKSLSLYLKPKNSKSKF